VLALLLIVGGFLGSGLTGAGAYFFPAFSAALKLSGQTVNVAAPPQTAVSGTPATAAPPPNGSAFTILLMGSDDDSKFAGSNPLTQSMILARVDPAAHQVTMLSIPRDLWVSIYTSSGAAAGQGKIDEAAGRGGLPEAIATVQANFGVHIDEFVWVGLTGLIRLIDLLGGVDVIVSNPIIDDSYPNDINSANAYSYMRVQLDPGVHHFDGKTAMEYVRSRHSDLRADFGRSLRQQQVLTALRTKAKTLDPADLPQLVNSFQGELKTSFNLTDLSRLRQLLSLASHLGPSSIKQVVMLGGNYTHDTIIGSQDALAPNWPAILSLTHNYFPTA
jgi:polyisoprenyl-teichoic acid--peptidoglycan teichoic acid transferase